MWWSDSRTRIFFDMHMPDWQDRQTCESFNPQELAETFYSSGADSVILYGKCQYGNSYYPTRIGKMHGGLKGFDLMGTLAGLLREKGIRVIAYYSVAWDEAYADDHPQHLVQSAAGTPGNPEFRWRTLCINSPYRERALSQMAEMTQMIKPDGVWIDMTIIGKDRCFCPRCRQAFLEQYGYPLPGDPAGKARHDFMQFRYGVIETFYQEAISRLKQVMPSVCITANYWGYPYSSWSMGTRTLEATRGLAYVTGEAYTDWTGLMAPGLFTRFLSGVGNGRPVEVLLSRFQITWDFARKSKAQLLSEMYTVAALSGCATIDDQPFHDGSIDPAVYAMVSEGFHEIRRRRPLLEGTRLAYAAVLTSQDSKDTYYLDDEAFTRSFSGAYSLLARMGVPVDFCFDHRLDLTELARYSVLLIPGMAVCSQEQWKQILAYIAEGGIAVAAGEFARYRLENGELIPSDMLSTLDIQDSGLSSGTLSYLRHGKGLELVRGKYVRYHGRPGAWGKVVEPICDAGSGRFFHNNLPAPYAETSTPAYIVLPYGRGKLVLFAQDIFAHYAAFASEALYHLAEDLLHRLAPPAPVRLMTYGNRMEVSALEKGDGLFVHLINFCPARTVCLGRMDTFLGQYERTIEHMEEVIPVPDVVLRLQGRKAVSAALAEGREAPEMEQDAEGVTIRLKSVCHWETLSIKTEAI